MAVVGTAYVRLRVIGDKLKNDIGSATKRAVDESAPDLARSGEHIGEHLTEHVGEELERGVNGELRRVADEAGSRIGQRMGEALGRSWRVRARDGIRDGLTRASSSIQSVRGRFMAEFDRFGKQNGESFGKAFEGKFKGWISTSLIGLSTALPSVLAFLGASIGAVAATAVTALSTLGPAAAGAALTGIAAFTSLKLTVGLVGLAMKAQTPILEDYKKRAEAFKNTIATPIQIGLLSGFNAAMRISQPIIAGITPMLKELGTNVGDIAIHLADTFRQTANLERLQRILTSNNDVVKAFNPAISNLAVAFSILLDHLSPITLFLAQMVADFAQWAVTAIQAAEASGRLDAFITSTFNALRFFVGILVDFGAGIYNVFKAAHAASGGMLTNLHDTAATFRAWTGSEAGQTKMVKFFQNMRIITQQVLHVLSQMTSAASHALANTNVDSVVRGWQMLVSFGKPIGQIFRSIQANAGGAWAQTFQNFANVVTQLANSGVFGIMARSLSMFFQVLSSILSLPGVPQLLGLAATAATLAKAFRLTWVMTKFLFGGLKLLWGVIAGIASVIGWPITLVLALAAALTWFFTQTKLGRAIIAAVWDFIKKAIGAAVDWIVSAWGHMVDAFKAAGAWIANIAGQIWNVIKTVFTTIVNFYVTFWTTVYNIVVTILTAVWNFIRPILTGIGNFFVTVFHGILAVVQFVLNLLYQIWIRIWPILALPVRILYGVIIYVFQAIWGFLQPIIMAIWNFMVTAWNAITTAVSTALNWVWGIIQTVWNAIWGFIVTVVTRIWNFYVMVWTAIFDAIKTALAWIWGVIVSVWNAVWGFISPILSRIRNTIVGVWNGIVGGVRGALNAVWGVVKSVWDTITGFISGVMDKIGSLVGKGWDFIKGAGSAVLDGLKKAVNVVIGVINTVIDGINWAINTANKLPGPDIPTIPRIPKLAQGGVVQPTNGGTLAMIAEAGRPERVEPLDSQGLSTRDRAIIAQLSGGGSGKPPQVNVYLGTRELMELVDVVVETREDQLADRVLTGTKG